MNEIKNSAVFEISDYWLVYRRDNGEPGHIELGACANSFARQEHYESTDGLRCVGKRYEKDGCRCYELYNIGHTLVKFAPRPNFGESVVAMFRGKKPSDAQREAYEQFEADLNAHGWKTVEA